MIAQWMGRHGFGPTCVLLLILAVATSPGGAVETVENQPGHNDGLCKSYSGLPAEEGDKAGMVFIPGGSFTNGVRQ
jgi:hypothetical protein